MQKKGTLYWITGLSGSGKTTIGNALYYELKEQGRQVVILDGDVLKGIIGDLLGYTQEDRRKRAGIYTNLCRTLTNQGIDVICCCIAMFHETREQNRQENENYIEVFLNVPKDVLLKRNKKGLYQQASQTKDVPVPGLTIAAEFPENPDLELVNDGTLSVRECLERILNTKPRKQLVPNEKETQYWNQYYQTLKPVKEETSFARAMMEYCEPGKTILDIGCGNGRDSIFFHDQGLDVTAVDASNQAISQLRERYQDADHLLFVCDDFVKSTTLYQQQYDYCYSRFTIHAITESQEQELIANVATALKTNGLFMIEVRGIHDEFYGKGEAAGRDAFIYEDHYRRFVRREELVKQLEDAGMKVIYQEEARGFAPYKDQDPIVIRVVARKEQ